MKVIDINKIPEGDPRRENYDATRDIYEYTYIDENGKTYKKNCYGDVKDFATFAKIINNYKDYLDDFRRILLKKIFFIRSKRIFCGFFTLLIVMLTVLFHFVSLASPIIYLQYYLNSTLIVFFTSLILPYVDIDNVKIEDYVNNKKISSLCKSYLKKIEKLNEYRDIYNNIKEQKIAIEKLNEQERINRIQEYAKKVKNEQLFSIYENLPLESKLELYGKSLKKRSSFQRDIPSYLKEKLENDHILENFAHQDKEIEEEFIKRSQAQQNSSNNRENVISFDRNQRSERSKKGNVPSYLRKNGDNLGIYLCNMPKNVAINESENEKARRR